MSSRTLQYSKKKIQQWGWQRRIKLNAKVHDLCYFFWETSLKCNLNCRHCGSDCGIERKNSELPANKVLKVFKDIADHYNSEKIMVAVTGGEPLVREDLFDILTEVSKMGFSWGMVTNGMLVDEKIVEKCVAAGMKTVSVSLDGLEKSHNFLRNNEMSYKRAVNALKLFNGSGYLGCVWEREVRDNFFYCGAGINVGSLLWDGSYGACPSLSKEWIQGNVDELLFSEAWETRYKNMRDRSWMSTDACEQCIEWKNCNGSSLHLWDWEDSKTSVCHFRLLNDTKI